MLHLYAKFHNNLFIIDQVAHLNLPTYKRMPNFFDNVEWCKRFELGFAFNAFSWFDINLIIAEKLDLFRLRYGCQFREFDKGDRI